MEIGRLTRGKEGGLGPAAGGKLLEMSCRIERGCSG